MNMKILKKGGIVMKLKINFQKLFIISIFLEILIPACKFCILQAVPGMFIFNDIANIITSILLFPFILISLLSMLKSNKFIYISFLCFIIPVMFTYLLYPENSDNLSEVIFRLFTVSFPMFCISYCIDDWKELFDWLYKASKIIALCAIFMQINIAIFGNVGSYDNVYSISFGYYCIIPFGIITYNYYISKKSNDLIFIVLIFIIVLISGSRGPLISMFMIFGHIYLIDTKLSSKKIIIFIIGIILIMICFLYLNEIINFLIGLLNKFDLSSRTLDYIKYGMLSSTSSRDNLRSEILNNVSNIGVLGNGVLSQNRLHSIFLENIFSFGILSIPINLGIVFACLKSFFLKHADKYHRYLLLIFLSYAIVDACLNLTVLGKDMFWIFLGLFLSIYRTKSVKQMVTKTYKNNKLKNMS